MVKNLLKTFISSMSLIVNLDVPVNSSFLDSIISSISSLRAAKAFGSSSM